VTRAAAARAAEVTVARVDGTSAWRRFAVGAAGPGWSRLADRLADPDTLDRWYAAELAGMAGGHRDLAGALITYRFAGSLAELVVGPLFDQRRALVLDPASLSILLAPDGARLDGVSLDRPAVAVLPDDPAAAGVPASSGGPAPVPTPTGSPSVTVVPDESGLRAVAVDGMLATFAPLAEAVRARAPFGLRGMWGTLADHLVEVALRRAREQGRPAEAAWAAADGLLDDLADRQALLRVRPRRQEVAAPGGTELFAAKGTCCLVYKPEGSVARGACTSCPLRPAADREAGFLRYLASLRGRA
jgi:hypothetical protein